MPWYNDYKKDCSLEKPAITLYDGTVVTDASVEMLTAQGWVFREYTPTPSPLPDGIPS